MEKNIYRVHVEVGHMSGTQLPDECAGGFVNVYVGALSLIEAIKRVEKSLEEDLYKVIETYEAYKLDLDEIDYDTEEEGYPNNKDLIHLQKTDEVWYGPFNIFPPEETEIH